MNKITVTIGLLNVVAFFYILYLIILECQKPVEKLNEYVLLLAAGLSLTMVISLIIIKKIYT